MKDERAVLNADLSSVSSPPYRPWRRRLKDPLFILFGVLTFICLVAIGLWIYTLSRLRVEMNIIRIEMQTHERERVVRDEAWRSEFDTIYKTLYSPPENTATISRRPSAVELWQVNRDKELRTRIQRLEQWRLRAEEK